METESAERVRCALANTTLRLLFSSCFGSAASPFFSVLVTLGRSSLSFSEREVISAPPLPTPSLLLFFARLWSSTRRALTWSPGTVFATSPVSRLEFATHPAGPQLGPGFCACRTRSTHGWGFLSSRSHCSETLSQECPELARLLSRTRSCLVPGLSNHLGWLVSNHPGVALGSACDQTRVIMTSIRVSLPNLV